MLYFSTIIYCYLLCNDTCSVTGGCISRTVEGGGGGARLKRKKIQIFLLSFLGLSETL